MLMGRGFLFFSNKKIERVKVKVKWLLMEIRLTKIKILGEEMGE